jgi:hypothetical protein
LRNCSKSKLRNKKLMKQSFLKTLLMNSMMEKYMKVLMMSFGLTSRARNGKKCGSKFRTKESQVILLLVNYKTIPTAILKMIVTQSTLRS